MMMDMSAALTPMQIPEERRPCRITHVDSRVPSTQRVNESIMMRLWDTVGRRHCSPTKLTTNQLCAASAKIDNLDHIHAHATSHLVPCPMYDECSLRVVRRRRFRSTIASWIQSGSMTFALSGLRCAINHTYSRKVFVFPAMTR